MWLASRQRGEGGERGIVSGIGSFEREVDFKRCWMESGMERGKSGKEEDGRGSTLLWGVYRISFLLRLLGRILPIVPFNIARFRWF